MNPLAHTAAAAIAAGAIVSCAASPAAMHEYGWVLTHGGCDCGPLAYADKRVVPSTAYRFDVAEYVRFTAKHCASRQFVVAAFGDADPDRDADLALARARAEPFVRELRRVAYRRLDTLAFGGPHIVHPATLVVMCPTQPLPAPEAF